jgi:hypothetical protein
MDPDLKLLAGCGSGQGSKNIIPDPGKNYSEKLI